MHRASSSTSELHAILSAIGYSDTTCEANKWLICTDSKRGFASPKSKNPRNPNTSLLYRIMQQSTVATERGHLIRIQWASGHRGVQGNAAADV